ncbi:MAG: hypothetical protein AAF191_12940, partial [Verrucomicrobiota bacterium]
MNIEVGRPDELTSYRKVAIASWRHPRDPSTYSWVDLPLEPMEAFLAEQNGKTAVTLTHVVAQIMGHCLERQPEFNRFLRRGKLYPRTSTDAFITTLLRGKKGKDLSGFVVRDVTGKSLQRVADECAEEAEKLRRGADPVMKRTQKTIDGLSAQALKSILRIQEAVAYGLNWDPWWLGMPKDRFGSFMLSNIGALGLERGLIPLSPYTRCPIILGLGK